MYTPPTQGAGIEAVDGEFEGGFDEDFELRFTKFGRLGRISMVVVALLGLAGFLGHGPFSHSTKTASDGSFSVDYEPVARSNAPTSVTLHIHPPIGEHLAAFFLNNGFLEPMGLQNIMPKPVTTAASGAGLRMQVAVQPGRGDTLVRINLMPASVGLIALEVQMLPDASRDASSDAASDAASHAASQAGPGATLHWRQFVLP